MLSDQIAFRKRQKLVRQSRELLYALKKSGGQFLPAHYPLWSRILHSLPCPGSFAESVLNDEIAWYVPTVPDLHWMEIFHCGRRSPFGSGLSRTGKDWCERT